MPLFSCNKNSLDNEPPVIDGYMKMTGSNDADLYKFYMLESEEEKVVFDEINLGKYNTLKNIKDDIKWTVLYKDTVSDKALLVTKYSLDYMPFNENGEKCTWETSSIRKWLNDGFYKNAFAEDEKKNIKITHVHANDNGYGVNG